MLPGPGPRNETDPAWQSAWDRAEADLGGARTDAARAGYERVLELHPGHPGALLRLSTLATSQGRYRDSVAALLALAAAPPDDAELLVLLAGNLHRLGESRAALACLHHHAIDASREPLLLARAAQAALQLEDLGRAQQLQDAATRIAGAQPGGFYAGATIALFQGRLDDAAALLDRCLALAPGHAQAHWSLSRLRRQTPADNHVDRLRACMRRAADPRERVYLAFALFKELDDLGELDGAWEALMQGCADKRALLAAAPATANAAADEAAAFDALHALWSDAAPRPVAEAMPGGDRTTKGAAMPIFIVGMPRTGTTLLERILAGSGCVADAGELDDIPLQLRWLADRFSRSLVDATVLRAAHARAGPGDAGLASRYLAQTAWRARGRAWFTDKLPMNFMHLGFIADALPDAPLLHMVRNPMDTCFSNLKELFTDAYPYSYSLEALAAHYDRYRRLMAHWHRCLPGRILDVPYEGFVNDPGHWARRILAHCGIPWTDDCLGLATRPGTVTTASSVQVREPIHGRSVQAWRRYAPQLAPLHRELARLGWLDDADASAGAAADATGAADTRGRGA
jgi:tetratricopeptide (TPR) repeat protein